MKIDLQSIITCPECGYKKEEEKPTGARQLYYICGNCLAILKTNSSDCCVFCSYGTVPCSTVKEYKKCS
jgi:hypothetical protein